MTAWSRHARRPAGEGFRSGRTEDRPVARWHAHLAARWVLALLGLAAIAPGIAAAQPPMPEVILDNASVMVMLVTYPPGSGTGQHQGVEAEIGVVLDGEIVLQDPSGRRVVRAGSAYFIPGLTPHDTRNESTRPVRALDILLKRCD